jgi:hypothetical protein
MEQPSSSCCPKSSWLPDPRFLISVISGEVLIFRSRRRPGSPESPLLAFWGGITRDLGDFGDLGYSPSPGIGQLGSQRTYVGSSQSHSRLAREFSGLFSFRIDFRFSSVPLRVLCGKGFWVFPACFLPPPGLFFSRIQNKALIRFHNCETQAWPLGDAWVTQGSPLGHPNPIPNGRGGAGRTLWPK